MTRKRNSRMSCTRVGGIVPFFKEGLLMKLIGRISKLNMAYANMALPV